MKEKISQCNPYVEKLEQVEKIESEILSVSEAGHRVSCFAPIDHTTHAYQMGVISRELKRATEEISPDTQSIFYKTLKD